LAGPTGPDVKDDIQYHLNFMYKNSTSNSDDFPAYILEYK